MPNMNGCEVCRKVKGSPETSDIPMLFLTGKGDPEDVVEGFEAGGSDYVKKPFNPVELISRYSVSLILDHYNNENVETAFHY